MKSIQSHPVPACAAHAPALRRAAGFSLIEVSLAVGIIAVSITTMLGLVPMGLTTMRDAADATVSAQIVQKVSGKALLTPYQDLPALMNDTWYFDQEGFEQAANDPDNRFQVSLATATTVYPGSQEADRGGSGGPLLPDSVTTLKIRVKTLNSSTPAKTFPLYVPNRDGQPQ